MPNLNQNYSCNLDLVNKMPVKSTAVPAKPVAANTARVTASARVLSKKGVKNRSRSRNASSDSDAGEVQIAKRKKLSDSSHEGKLNEPDMANEEAIRKKRLELNRKAAIKSRAKKKEYLKSLHSSVAALTKENRTFWEESRRLTSSYARLREAHASIFEENTVLRRNLNLLSSAYDKLIKGADAKVKKSAAVVAAAPVLEFTKKLATQAVPQPFPSTLAPDVANGYVH